MQVNQPTKQGRIAFAVLATAVVICLLPRTPVAAETPPCSALEARQQHQLEMAAQEFLRVVREADVEGLIVLLAEEVEIATDVIATKQELARSLRRKEGTKYVSLFDTARYRALVEEWRKRFTPQQRATMPPLDSVRSARDHLLSVRRVAVRVCPMPAGVWGPHTLAVVSFDWPQRPTVMDLQNSMFILTDNGWKISMLFSVVGR